MSTIIESLAPFFPNLIPFSRRHFWKAVCSRHFLYYLCERKFWRFSKSQKKQSMGCYIDKQDLVYDKKFVDTVSNFMDSKKKSQEFKSFTKELLWKQRLVVYSCFFCQMERFAAVHDIFLCDNISLWEKLPFLVLLQKLPFTISHLFSRNWNSVKTHC